MKALVERWQAVFWTAVILLLFAAAVGTIMPRIIFTARDGASLDPISCTRCGRPVSRPSARRITAAWYCPDCFRRLQDESPQPPLDLAPDQSR